MTDKPEYYIGPVRLGSDPKVWEALEKHRKWAEENLETKPIGNGWHRVREKDGK